MFGIGMTEMLLVFVVALLFIGPKRLPVFARSLGRILSHFSEASRVFYRALSDAAGEHDDGKAPGIPDWLSDAARPLKGSFKVKNIDDADENKK